MEVTMVGQLMAVKLTKTGKRYLSVYANDRLYNVFLKQDDNREFNQHIGKPINIKVVIYEPKFIQAIQ